jgi:hypothetical protein
VHNTIKNGSAAHVKLNYNSLFGEIKFIDPKKGDTISLAEEKNTLERVETWVKENIIDFLKSGDMTKLPGYRQTL